MGNTNRKFPVRLVVSPIFDKRARNGRPRRPIREMVTCSEDVFQCEGSKDHSDRETNEITLHIYGLPGLAARSLTDFRYVSSSDGTQKYSPISVPALNFAVAFVTQGCV